MRVVSIAGLFLMLVAVLGLMYRHALLSGSPIVIGVQVVAVGIVLWAQIRPPGRTPSVGQAWRSVPSRSRGRPNPFTACGRP